MPILPVVVAMATAVIPSVAVTVTHTWTFVSDLLATPMRLMKNAHWEVGLQGQLVVTQSHLEAELVVCPIPSLYQFRGVGW